MARLRTIKPEFFTSEQIVECSTNARLQFLGILCFSDDGGIHPASVKRLKMEVWPGDQVSEKDVTKYMAELIRISRDSFSISWHLSQSSLYPGQSSPSASCF